jgi:hypothetical protein
MSRELQAQARNGFQFAICRPDIEKRLSEPILCMQVIFPARLLMLQLHKVIHTVETTYTSQRLTGFSGCILNRLAKVCQPFFFSNWRYLPAPSNGK